MTAKHTPGPWVAKHDFRRHRPHYVESSEAHIADILPCAINEKMDAEAAANARLIAATPDLLEALRNLLAANDAAQLALCGGPDIPGFDPQALPEAQKQVCIAEDAARAALAKAGEA
jgi:hypothetical protein